jgi:acetyl esterase/lipase
MDGISHAQPWVLAEKLARPHHIIARHGQEVRKQRSQVTRQLQGVISPPASGEHVKNLLNHFRVDGGLEGAIPDAPDSPESQLIGGAIQDNKDKAARANPITYVSKDDPPFFIVHGDQDPLIPLNQSQLLHEALNKAGVQVTLQVIKGAGHGGPAFQAPQIDELVFTFFDKHLKAPKGK